MALLNDDVKFIIEAIQQLPQMVWAADQMQAAQAYRDKAAAGNREADGPTGAMQAARPMPQPMQPPQPRQQYARPRGTADAAVAYAQREIVAGRPCTWRRACETVGYRDSWSESEHAPY